VSYLTLPAKKGGVDMTIQTDNIATMTEANQNFSRVARMADEKGSVTIFKNNMPGYILIKFSAVKDEEQASDEEVLSVAKRLIDKNRQALEVLAK
jgi:antitoxin Phd